MSVLLPETTWYKGDIPIYQISEISIVNNYAETGVEDQVWDASAANDGSVICYRISTAIVMVCDNLVSIGDKMFARFLSLEKITGLSNVSTIGARAFCLTPKLVNVDIDPSKITKIGESAFKMSSAEDSLDLSVVPLDSIGDKATRRKRWGDDQLAALSNVEFPLTVKPHIPNMDCQMLYSDVPYGNKNGTIMYGNSGCVSFSYYHVWNYLFANTDKRYNNWMQWYNDTLNLDGTFAENNNNMSDGVFTINLITEKLGWEFVNIEYVSTTSNLEYIIDRVTNGLPVVATMHSNNSTGKHAIAIVGCDKDTRKLAIVDSAATDDIGVLYWASFEDVFVGGIKDYDFIHVVKYNHPVIAPNCTWFTKGGSTVNRADITQITIKDTYTPTSDVTSSWDASAANDNSVMAYVEGSTLTIAGNGSGKVFANPDSSWVFSDSAKKDYYSKLTEIVGADVLDTGKATTMERMFQSSTSLKSVDVSKWDTSNAVSMMCMFQACQSLSKLDVGAWDTSHVTNMTAMFNNTNKNTKLTYLDVSLWDVSNVTVMNSMFRGLAVLAELDLSNWNVANVTSMKQLFYDCTSLKKIAGTNNWDTKMCTDMSLMFVQCVKLTELDFSKWDTSNVVTDDDMFVNTYRLAKVIVGDKFTLTNGIAPPSSQYIQDADGNWYDINYNAYTSIPSKVMRTYYASRGIAEADADRLAMIQNGTVMRIAEAIRSVSGKNGGISPSHFAEEIESIEAGGDTTELQERILELENQIAENETVANMFEIRTRTPRLDYLFYACNTFNTFPMFDTSAAKNMSHMFSTCSALETVPQYDTTNVTAMQYMFNYCAKLISVPAFDVRSLSTTSNMFGSCASLRECWIRNIGANLQVASGSTYGHLLSVESLMHLIQELRDTGSIKTLTIGNVNLEKLADIRVRLVPVTDEMRTNDDLIDEKYPFEVCEATDEGAMTFEEYAAGKNWQLV